jgi:hypothetical protein
MFEKLNVAEHFDIAVTHEDSDKETAQPSHLMELMSFSYGYKLLCFRKLPK